MRLVEITKGVSRLKRDDMYGLRHSTAFDDAELAQETWKELLVR